MTISVKKFTVATIVTPAVFAASSAFAAVPIEITTALADAKTDSLAVASLALVLIVSVAAFKYMRRGL